MTKDIPKDFLGLRCVPSIFLDRWDPEQFDVVDLCDGSVQTRSLSTDGDFYLRVNTPPVGRSFYRVGDDKRVYTYKRVGIRRKR